MPFMDVRIEDDCCLLQKKTCLPPFRIICYLLTFGLVSRGGSFVYNVCLLLLQSGAEHNRGMVVGPVCFYFILRYLM